MEAASTKRWEKTRKLYAGGQWYDEEPRVRYYESLKKILEAKGFAFGPKKTCLEIGGGEFPFLKVVDTEDCYVVDPFERPLYKDYRFHSALMKAEDYEPGLDFDYILSFNVIDHVDDIDKAMEAIKRHLKKGGRVAIILNTYYQLGLQRFFQRFNPYFDRPHPYHFTKDQFVERMGKHGLRLVDFMERVEEEINVPWDRSGGQKLAEILRDPLLLVRIAIIRGSVALTGKPFRPAHLYVFEG